MANLKRPELKLSGNVGENFHNFELCFNNYYIQANYRDLKKDSVTEQSDHYKSPNIILEISICDIHYQMKRSLYSDIQSSLKYLQLTKENRRFGWPNFAPILLALLGVRF